MLKQYVEKGVIELDDARLKGLIELKYKRVPDAKVILGGIKRIRATFIGFQEFLYEDDTVNNYDEQGTKWLNPRRNMGNRY